MLHSMLEVRHNLTAQDKLSLFSISQVACSTVEGASLSCNHSCMNTTISSSNIWTLLNYFSNKNIFWAFHSLVQLSARTQHCRGLLQSVIPSFVNTAFAQSAESPVCSRWTLTLFRSQSWSHQWWSHQLQMTNTEEHIYAVCIVLIGSNRHSFHCTTNDLQDEALW